MKKHISISIVLPLMLIAATFSCCNQVSSSTKNTHKAAGSPVADTLLYRYRDATTPPQYHRSYSILVTERQVKHTVDVYGDIIQKDSLALSPETFSSFVSAINALQIEDSEKDNPDNCVGGSSQYISLYPRTDKEVRASLYNCGGKEESSNDKKINAAAALFRNLLQGMQKSGAGTSK